MGAVRRLDEDGVAALLRLTIGEIPSGGIVQAVCDRTRGELRPLLRLLWQAFGADDEPLRALATLACVASGSEMGPLRYTFRREGEYWTIVFDGRTSRLRDRIGFRHLAMLLRRPGVRVPAFELAPGSSRGTEGARVRVTKAMRTAIACIASTDPAFGAHLRATIRLGTGCAYLPTDLDARTWEVEV